MKGLINRIKELPLELIFVLVGILAFIIGLIDAIRLNAHSFPELSIVGKICSGYIVLVLLYSIIVSWFAPLILWIKRLFKK